MLGTRIQVRVPPLYIYWIYLVVATVADIYNKLCCLVGVVPQRRRSVHTYEV